MLNITTNLCSYYVLGSAYQGLAAAECLFSLGYHQPHVILQQAYLLLAFLQKVNAARISGMLCVSSHLIFQVELFTPQQLLPA